MKALQCQFRSHLHAAADFNAAAIVRHLSDLHKNLFDTCEMHAFNETCTLYSTTFRSEGGQTQRLTSWQSLTCVPLGQKYSRALILSASSSSRLKLTSSLT